MLQLTRPLAVVDLETTGVDVEQDRIVQLGVVRIEPGGGRAEASWLVHPGCTIPADAAAVHGITDDDVLGCDLFPALVPDLLQLLAGADLAGFNLRSFDLPMLQAELRRAGVAAWPPPGTQVVDAFRIFNRHEPRNLDAASRWYLNRNHTDGHDAVADAKATLDVLEAQAAKYSAPTLAQLAELERDPEWIDREGKLRWKNGEAVFTFGKMVDRPLRQAETGYLRWMLGGTFPDDTKAIIEAALAGRFPQRKGAA